MYIVFNIIYVRYKIEYRKIDCLNYITHEFRNENRSFNYALLTEGRGKLLLKIRSEFVFFFL